MIKVNVDKGYMTFDSKSTSSEVVQAIRNAYYVKGGELKDLSGFAILEESLPELEYNFVDYESIAAGKFLAYSYYDESYCILL